MKTRQAWIIRRTMLPTVIVLLVVAGSTPGQTNWTSATDNPSNTVLRVRLPSEFERLQYYYAAHPTSPAPGTERRIFTFGDDRRWRGDWNSRVVPKPTRAQLNAITAPQVDLFRRAGVFTNGAWRVVTSRTSLPLAELSARAGEYARLGLELERDAAQQRYQELEQRLQLLSTR